MTVMIAVFLVSTLYLIALLPLGLAVRFKRRAHALAAIYLVAISMIAFYQTGLLSTSSLADTDVSQFPTSITETSRCDEAIELLKEAGIVLERSPSRLVVAGAPWNQLPSEVRDTVVNCISRTLPSGSRAVEVLER